MCTYAFLIDYSKLLWRMSRESGKSAAFTIYIAGKRMTFIKSPEASTSSLLLVLVLTLTLTRNYLKDFSSVFRESKRLPFEPVAS